ncbi:class I SAM-dependent methyltransferase [Ferruginibacter yonginensis]|uniref:Class I SAM-dependent methyltransferase n=1 Tax=Ferruginibacter yonginensis TaxID=1310416 RepID=A0ABV8QLS3_9BACT
MYIHETSVHNTQAAEVVVPIMMQLFQPQSVLDVGCGIGTWLKVFKHHGVDHITGIDGDYVNRTQLFENITTDTFIAADLTQPFAIGKQFDLAICLEVAEHLPPAAAADFVKSICAHADTVVFGAAVPGQWGQHHLNEQWPAYWMSLFAAEGFAAYDLLRSSIWHHPQVEWWYQQNMLVFSKKVWSVPAVPVAYDAIIHPAHFNQKLQYIAQLAQQHHEAQHELALWQQGKKGVRQHFKSFSKALASKFFK